MLNVNEVFYSIQGEGANAGRAAVFVRLAGCNLKCPWCDTEHTKRESLLVAEIVGRACRLTEGDNTLAVITGGEPTIQDIAPLVVALKAKGFRVAVETNGTKYTNALRLADWVTVSPKPDSPLSKRAMAEADEIKVVLSPDLCVADPFRWASMASDDCLLFLQPCSQDNNERAVQFVKDNPRWRLSVQVQKYLNIR